MLTQNRWFLYSTGVTGFGRAVPDHQFRGEDSTVAAHLFAGEHFEQQPIDTEDGDLYVSFWNSGDDYAIMTQDELDAYIESQGMKMGECNIWPCSFRQ